ncbi:MAG TPA: DUF2141 domain-containing protein [Candidatus Wallbacteria bacterium]|nr:DUF2141 domain-containing protein [Candidatus Wallbacteria bacterium]
MKKTLIIIAALIISLLSVPAGSAGFYKLAGTIRGLSGHYKAYIFLYNAGPDSWFANDAYKKIIIYPSNIKDGKADYSFMLPEGAYAVAAFEDTNDNQKLDVGGFFSVPREPYGFYRRYYSFWRMPSFSDCALNLSENFLNANIPLTRK